MLSKPRILEFDNGRGVWTIRPSGSRLRRWWRSAPIIVKLLFAQMLFAYMWIVGCVAWLITMAIISR